MTREAFISELKEKLNRLPQGELEAALDYYTELFLDAGVDKEEATAASLGSIDEIARQIYIDNGIDPDGKPEFLLEEYNEPEKQEEPKAGPLPIQQPGPAPRYQQQGGLNATKLLLLILLFPIWLPILIVCLVLSFVGIILAFVFEIVLIAVGGSLIIEGILTVGYIPPLGIIYIGAGLILTGLFVLTLPLIGKGFFRGLRGAANRIANSAHNILFGGAYNG